RHSLVQPDHTGPGPRLRMLETIREFIAERLAAPPDAADGARRPADYYPAPAARADPPLPRARQRGWARRPPAAAGHPPPPPGPRPAAAAAPVPDPVAVLGAAGRLGRGPHLGRTAASHRRRPRTPGPRRAAVDSGGDGRRGGRRHRGPVGAPAPEAAAGPGRR